MRGTGDLDEAAITDELATAPSPKFLGLFRGVLYDYEIFDPFALQRDLARVERLYRARGYYAAHARAGRVITTGQGHVRVEIIVEEGEPVRLGDVRVTWNGGVPASVEQAITTSTRRAMRTGTAFDEDKLKDSEKATLKALTDRGYAFAKVRTDAFVDVVALRANVVFEVDPGIPAVFGKISIVGLDPDGKGAAPQEIPEAAIRRTLDLVEGAPYSTAAIDSATQALLDLEIFSVVQIVPELPDPPTSSVVPVAIKLELTKLRQLRLGGGLEFDQIKTDLHLLVGWEDHNFLGGLRDLTIDLRPGVVLYPTRINTFSAPERLLPEERLRVQLRQPGFVEARTNGYVRPELNTFPLLVATDTETDEPVVGYTEFKGAAGLDRTFGKLFVGFGYNAQVEYPFAYKGTLDPALRTLVISYPELVTRLDFRDSRLHPKKGIYLANALQVAGGPFQGDVRDVKVQPEVRTYLPIRRRVVFATRAALGFLFASNYGDVVRNHLDPRTDPLTPENRDERVRDIETVYFRGLFSGGASSNRGFPIRGIAPHGVVPFLNPSTASRQIAARCNPTRLNPTPDPVACAIPIGGFTLWELSNELRVAVAGPFSAAAFCDMSDVSPRAANIRLDHLHLSCGLGARYETPVGPIRLDLGYRIQPLQVLGYKDEAAVTAGEPLEGKQPTFLGVPLALALGIGETF